MIYLISEDPVMCKNWAEDFSGYKDVQIINKPLFEFLYTNEDIDGIVIPGNSFGYLKTLFGKEIIECLGEEAQTNILTMVDSVYHGYQPIGSACDVPFDRYTLIHTPTSRFNEPLLDDSIIFDCMMSCLRCAKISNLENVVIPVIGGNSSYKFSYSAISGFMELALKIFTIGHIDMSNRCMNMIRCKIDKIRGKNNWLI